MRAGTRRKGQGSSGAILALLWLASMSQAFRPPPTLVTRVRPGESLMQLGTPRMSISKPYASALHRERMAWGLPSVAPARKPSGRVFAEGDDSSSGGMSSLGTRSPRRRWASRLFGHLGRAAKVIVLPALLGLTVLGPRRALAAYREGHMSMGAHMLAAVLGRIIIPGICFLYVYLNLDKKAKEEARKVKRALEAEEKKKQDYIEEMKKQGVNLGGVGGTFSKEEEDMLKRVEKGEQLLASDKVAWVALLKRAQYSRDVVDGKVNANAEMAIMTKKELKRVITANKLLKDKGFASE